MLNINIASVISQSVKICISYYITLQYTRKYEKIYAMWTAILSIFRQQLTSYENISNIQYTSIYKGSLSRVVSKDEYWLKLNTGIRSTKFLRLKTL